MPPGRPLAAGAHQRDLGFRSPTLTPAWELMKNSQHSEGLRAVLCRFRVLLKQVLAAVLAVAHPR